MLSAGNLYPRSSCCRKVPYLPKIFSATSSFLSNGLENLVKIKENKNFKMTVRPSGKLYDSFGKVSKVSSIYLAFIIHISRTIICNQMSKNLVNFTIFFFKMTKTKCKHQLLDSTADYWVALTNESSFSIYKFSVMRNQNKNFCRLSAVHRSATCVWSVK